MGEETETVMLAQNTTVFANRDELEAAKDHVLAVNESNIAEVETYEDNLAVLEDIVTDRVKKEENASDIYEHQLAVAKRAEGLLENTTYHDGLIPAEVTAATNEHNQAVAQAATAKAAMDAAQQEYDTTWDHHEQAEKELATLETQWNTLDQTVKPSVEGQKSNADSAAATAKSTFTTASGTEDTRRVMRQTKREARDVAEDAWELAVEFEDRREVERMQAVTDREIKYKIWQEKIFKLEQANTALEIASKAWTAAESDTKYKLNLVVVTEGYAQQAEAYMEQCQERADDLKEWLDQLMGIREDDDDEELRGGAARVGRIERGGGVGSGRSKPLAASLP